MTPLDYEIAFHTVAGEARGGTAEEQLGVAWSLRNRLGVEHGGKYGTSVAEVCLRKDQYDCWLQGEPGTAQHANWLATLAADSQPWFQNIVNIVDAVFDDRTPDPTDGATHYWDDSISEPEWADKAIITGKIGRLTFAKDVP